MEGHYFLVLFFHQTLYNYPHGHVLPWVTLLRYPATEPRNKSPECDGLLLAASISRPSLQNLQDAPWAILAPPLTPLF